jgi:peptidoglycan/LPS O-acetylase OafA/YrhL
MPRGFAYLMIVEAATFLVASLLHLTVEWEPNAAGPEALIGVVMAVGAFFAFRGRRSVALWTSAFAAFGTCVGITAISAGPGPKSVPDLTYHGLILTTLVVSIVLMVRSRQALSRS